MGAWGYGIRQDDFVLDVIGVFEDLLKAGNSIREATDAVSSKFADEILDADDGPLFWIALADVQWTYGTLEPLTFSRVKEDLDAGRSLAAWTEDQRALSRRRAALEKFITKIAHSNPRPKKLPNVVIRAPKFRPGDCLSIRRSDGRYAAALVLAVDHSTVEYGRDLVGVLDYLSSEKPAIEVFRDRKWLDLNPDGVPTMDIAWYHYIGFRAVKNKLEVVGEVAILGADPKDSNVYRRWTGIGERVLQRDADVQNG